MVRLSNYFANRPQKYIIICILPKKSVLLHANYEIMSIKTFFNDTKIGFILKNLLIALAIGIVLLIVLLSYLKRYTEHGIEVEVPNVTGMYIEEANTLAAHEGLQIEVVDSTYSKKVPLGTIVEQTPVANSHCKHGRPIYVIINSKTVRQVPLPNLHDISYRQAEATLRTLNIGVGNCIYEPSEYRDLVLDVRKGGKSVQPGERLDEGSMVTLVIGRGRSNAKVEVPNIIGRSLTGARSTLLSKYLTLGMIAYDEDPTPETSSLYVVYKQEPAAGTVLYEGSRVDLYLTTDIEKAISAQNTNDEDDFF